eukprot:TRINITY_DN9470_c0_g2_i2.p1 TRINITY_DN9470_c0_g2~~TRINITY_DN9470_c0_g2_i2.p1  ORF type:complete len:278 (-),score=49.02 TRINITY_DN9470_c0_g2_i2:153-926(-)
MCIRDSSMNYHEVLLLIIILGSLHAQNANIDIHQDGETYTITPKYIQPQRTLIWVHGMGNRSAGFLPFFTEYFKQYKPDFRVILPTAPVRDVTVYGDRRTSWFDIQGFNFTYEQAVNVVNKTQADISYGTIRRYVNVAVAFHRGDAKKVFIGGYSQGACMSLYVGLQYPKTLGGIMSICGFVFPFIRESQAAKTIPILMSHGKIDPKFTFSMMQSSLCRFKGSQHKILENWLEDVPHLFTWDVLDAMHRFFSDIIHI